MQRRDWEGLGGGRIWHPNPTDISRPTKTRENAMNTITRFAAAALFGTAFATAASAQDAGPRVVGTGDNASVEYSTPSRNILGGALTRTTGSGEGASTEIVSVQHVQPGRVVLRVTNSGDNQEIVYGDAAPALRLAQGGVRG